MTIKQDPSGTPSESNDAGSDIEERLLETETETEPADSETDSSASETEDSNSQKWVLSKSDMHFAFGPSRSFAIHCRGRYRYFGSQKDVDGINGLNLESNILAVLKHNGGWYVGGKQKNGQAVWAWTTCDDTEIIRAGQAEAWVKQRDAYENLYNWVRTTYGGSVSKLQDISLTIGPLGSYFARCGKEYITHGLPDDLMEAIATEKEKGVLPALVALGAADTWVVLWSNGYRSWNLDVLYPKLTASKAMKMDRGEVVFIALDGYQPGNFFIVTKSGMSNFMLNMEGTGNIEYIDEATVDYMQKRAREDDTCFDHSFYQNGVQQSFRIDKTTKYDFGGKKPDIGLSSRLMATLGLGQKGLEVRTSPGYGKSVGGAWGGNLLAQRRMLMRTDNMAVMGAAAVGAAGMGKVLGLSNGKAVLVGGVAAGAVGVSLVLAKS